MMSWICQELASKDSKLKASESELDQLKLDLSNERKTLNGRNEVHLNEISDLKAGIILAWQLNLFKICQPLIMFYFLKTWQTKIWNLLDQLCADFSNEQKTLNERNEAGLSKIASLKNGMIFNLKNNWFISIWANFWKGSIIWSVPNLAKKKKLYQLVPYFLN